MRQGPAYLGENPLVVARAARGPTIAGIVTPFDFGGVGDGTTDDTSALQAWIDAACGGAAGSEPVTGRYAEKIAFLPAGAWKFTSKLRILSVLHLHVDCHPDAFLEPTGTWADSTVALEINGAYHCTFENLTFRQSGTAPTLTDIVTIDWSSAIASRSTSGNVFRNTQFLDIAWANAALAIGKNSAGVQVDDGTYYDTTINGGYVVGSGNTTTYQYGVQVGNGTHGNVLNHFFFGFSCGSTRYSLWSNAVTAVGVFGFDVGSCEANFKQTGSTNFVADTGRSESSERLFIQAGGASYGSTASLSNITFGTDELHADLRFVHAFYGGAVTLTNVFVGVATLGATVYAHTTGPLLAVNLTGCLIPTSAETVVERTGEEANVSVDLIGYVELNGSGQPANITGHKSISRSGGGSDSEFGTLTAGVKLGTAGTSAAWVDTVGSGTDIDLNLRAKGVGLINFRNRLQMLDGNDIVTGTTTGSKIGTTTSQKLALWGATPVAQQAAVADATGAGDVVAQLNSLLAKLRTVGIIAT